MENAPHVIAQAFQKAAHMGSAMFSVPVEISEEPVHIAQLLQYFAPGFFLRQGSLQRSFPEE